jgi:hypoxanthine phosphoribosyltransferase
MKKVYYNWKEVEGACLEIARSIIVSKWQPDYIVGITRGGAIPAVMLSQYLGVPMRPLEVSLRDGGQVVSDCGMSEDAYGYTTREVDFYQGDTIEMTSEGVAKNILIVDDINDTGATFNWIKEDWRKSCIPDDPVWDNDIWHNNVRFAVLTNNLASKADIDYYCWEVNKAEEDCWLVYPWEEFWK